MAKKKKPAQKKMNVSCSHCGCPCDGCIDCGAEDESWDITPVAPPAPGTMDYDLQQIYCKAIKEELNNRAPLGLFG